MVVIADQKKEGALNADRDCWIFYFLTNPFREPKPSLSKQFGTKNHHHGDLNKSGCSLLTLCFNELGQYKANGRQGDYREVKNQ